ncbi:MAG: ABC transporter substrate-binding protein [Chloroflexi bacterium HGW-Chloroflexi-4]|jgi:ABC-type Zn uptake system ZnuABC Zn-binding protein ZnuA|nr:MAG: ABC transporter substrate-binding protein [Chloroflexi bacterium HGW-Chloroflexi-7]PKN98648.1 MAG: ABC transporter substrate-binding protein [Chloroflexi bacterium HGW-Chloroflexi-4]
MKKSTFAIFLIMLISLAACTPSESSKTDIKIVASTTLVGDVVSQIGGDHIQLTVLFPVGADPHTFEPRPQDVAAISEARVIFLNGLELEHSLESILDSNATGSIVEVSEGVEVLPFKGNLHEGETESDHAVGDPHTWMDPNLVMIWVNNIETALSELDPDNATDYAANAQTYLAELTDLDAWIQTEVDKIPVEARKLVTDHENLGYFIHRYNFTLVGLVVDSLSTGASPSAQDLSALEDAIKEQNVKAIFIGATVNPNLTEQVVKDTGTKLITINTESLGEKGSDTATYIDFMKKLVTAVVDGLQ